MAGILFPYHTLSGVVDNFSHDQRFYDEAIFDIIQSQVSWERPKQLSSVFYVNSANINKPYHQRSTFL
jgi:hypothetical protein